MTFLAFWLVEAVGLAYPQRLPVVVITVRSDAEVGNE